jgi:PAS domain-containing protein
LRLVSGFEALLALLGYAYGIKSLYSVGSFIPMAAHTAAAFLLIAGGIMACQAQRGFLAVVLGGNAGGAMARRLLPAAIFLPAVLGWLRLEGQRAGLYDSDFGVALYTGHEHGRFRSAHLLQRPLALPHRHRAHQSGAAAARAHNELERRVQERTAQLIEANAALRTVKDELEARVAERTATLAESEARLNAILDNGTSIVYLKDLEDRYILVNRCFAELLGRQKEEIVGRTNGGVYFRGKRLSSSGRVISRH